ncbi:hypothetical protein RI845_15945 [Thalassotalea nanhaiensis]|uniref:MFS transporter n=1 Tax=Thalassotalea nanhaiensis TaxID=3065648 RepID=A0ABY9TGR2_9GAMM|nr:hypothetical protein RI845_15945 [Colwelliaceae bacterium SQ345]
MCEVTHSPTKGIGWLLLANCLERLAYYGFRAILVLFLIDQGSGGVGWPTDKTLEFYGEFTAYTYLAVIVGGLCADFLVGAYLSTLLGAALMALGYIGLTFIDSQSIYYATSLIAIGTGLFKPNIPAMIAHQLQNFPEKLNSVFTGQYLLINIGALLAPIIVGATAEHVGWSTGFALSAAVVSAAFLIILSQSKHLSKQSKQSNIKTKEQGGNLFAGIGVVVVTFVLSALFWAYYEVGASLLYGSFSEVMNDIGLIFSITSVLVTCITCFFLWWFFKIRSWYMVALSFSIYSIGWFFLNYSISNEWNIRQIIILVMVLHAIAEVICSVIFMSIIAKKGFKPLISTSFAIHLYASALANFAGSHFTDGNKSLEALGWVCLTVGILLMLVQYSYNKFSGKKPILAT